MDGADSFDVVLLDQLMPGMSGADVLALIQTIAPNLPVIIITGSVTDESTIELKGQDAFDCLGKPFTPAELRKVILKAVGKTAPE